MSQSGSDPLSSGPPDACLQDESPDSSLAPSEFRRCEIVP